MAELSSLADVFVLPEHRGAGLGERLVTDATLLERLRRPRA